MDPESLSLQHAHCLWSCHCALRVRPRLLYTLPLGGRGQQRDLLAVPLPGWTSPAPPAPPHSTSAPAPDLVALCLLNSPQVSKVSPVLASPKLDTVLWMQYHQCWRERKTSHPWPASNSLPNAGRDVLGLLPWLMSSLLSTRTPRSFSTKPQSGLQPVVVPGVFLAYSAFPIAKFHEVAVGPFLQPIWALWMATQPSGIWATTSYNLVWSTARWGYILSCYLGH